MRFLLTLWGENNRKHEKRLEMSKTQNWKDWAEKVKGLSRKGQRTEVKTNQGKERKVECQRNKILIIILRLFTELFIINNS